MSKKKIENKANTLSLAESLLESTGQSVPTKDKVKESNSPQVTPDTSWTHFTVICNGELVEKIKAIAQHEGFTIREVVEKFFRSGITIYEGKHGPIKVKTRKKQNIDDVL